MTNREATGQFILIEFLEQDKQSAGGLYLPPTVSSPGPERAVVLSMGDGDISFFDNGIPDGIVPETVIEVLPGAGVRFTEDGHKLAYIDVKEVLGYIEDEGGESDSDKPTEPVPN